MQYNIISENGENTVVAEYNPGYNKESNYQSEAELERAFIKQLQEQAYEYLPIKNENDLIINLRKQLEKLNNYSFSDNEWDDFFKKIIANEKFSIVEKTKLIQEDHIQLLKCDNGSIKNIYLLDKENIHNNSLQVINQYEEDKGQRANRYDVTILVNGLPLVHVELKRRGVELREAFNQINRYSRESFWAGTGLFEYVQIFVISNGTFTKYYSNTTRYQHIKNAQTSNKYTSKVQEKSNSFEFTSWWADANNKPITDLMDFCSTFFIKHTILNLLTKYCIFTTDELLLVMRPYQIAATENIINKINISNNYKTYGTADAGGYVWHTTGSGKTLTSFKAAQLASKLPFIEKVLFVVDRKDLDYQTMKEYDKFQKGAANSNSSTTILKKQLEDPNARIIITTIQKLSILIKQYKSNKITQKDSSLNSIFDKHVVIIFDECHRSQFGEMHTAITKTFKKYHLFGFTGTPIFAINSNQNNKVNLQTTEQAFGQKLHSYNIVDAIRDKNVLPFRVEYLSTMKEKECIANEKIWDIDRENALAAPERISRIVQYIIEHFDQQTKRNSYYQLKERRLAGFNSILAVASISLAMKYYAEFKKQLDLLPSDKRLKIAIIYSFGANEDVDELNGLIEDESIDNTNSLDQSSRDFLDSAIQDYNEMFSTNFDTSAAKFQNYYKDISQRVKDREVDILIVVNMFLTGFDATTLNTLWVDKNLRLHGLLQAFSRTNRILNSIKTFGNIVCFRNLENETNKSIALFGDKEAGGIVLLKTFKDYYNGYKDEDKQIKGYAEMVDNLQKQFRPGENIVGEENQTNFIKQFGQILKTKNILSTFDEFNGKEILSERDFQDYQSTYLDLYSQFREKDKGQAVIINDDLVFEIELIKQVEINIDYILALVEEYHENNCADKEIKIKIKKALSSSFDLRDKIDLIEDFMNTLTPTSNVLDDWNVFVNTKKIKDLNNIILEENLNKEATFTYFNNAFRDGYLPTIGTVLNDILPPISRFNPTEERSKKREIVLEKFNNFFKFYWNIANNKFDD